MDEEVYYDADIAPLLMDIATKCEAKGIPFLAMVEYATGKCSRTEFLPKSACMSQRMATWAARAEANVDLLMFAIQKHAREHGHSSAILTILGDSPDTTSDEAVDALKKTR